MSDMTPQGTQADGVPFGHDDSDVNVKALLIGVFIVASGTLVTILAMAGMLNFLKARELAKHDQIPQFFVQRQTMDIPGPALYPSLQTSPGSAEEQPYNHQPWVQYRIERNGLEAEAAATGIYDKNVGFFVVPDSAPVPQTGPVLNPFAARPDNLESPFSDNWKWDSAEKKMSMISSGGTNLPSVQPPIVVK